MQSILFIMRYFIEDSRDSLSFKFRNQIQAARNLGLDVWYVALENEVISLFHEDKKIELAAYNSSNRKSLFNSIRLYLLFYKAILRLLDIKSDFNFVYIRSMTTMPSLLKALRILKKSGAQIVLEIPTYPGIVEDESEQRLIRKMIMKFDKKVERYRNNYVDLFTLIGDQADNYRGKPAINIENGICLDIIPERTAKISKEEIHCLGLASMCRWQGYDRFIRGMFEYKRNGGKDKIILHLAGADGDGSLQQWKELAHRYNLEDEVVFEGEVYGVELDQLVNLCDIGIGTLGGYRKNLGNSSTLKIREYTARGLPFVYAVKDKALTNKLKFALKLPDEDTPIDMKVVIGFVRKIRNENDIQTTMRNYAHLNMSWEKQFRRVLSYF